MTVVMIVAGIGSVYYPFPALTDSGAAEAQWSPRAEQKNSSLLN